VFPAVISLFRLRGCLMNRKGEEVEEGPVPKTGPRPRRGPLGFISVQPFGDVQFLAFTLANFGIVPVNGKVIDAGESVAPLSEVVSLTGKNRPFYLRVMAFPADKRHLAVANPLLEKAIFVIFKAVLLLIAALPNLLEPDKMCVPKPSATLHKRAKAFVKNLVEDADAGFEKNRVICRKNAALAYLRDFSARGPRRQSAD